MSLRSSYCHGARQRAEANSQLVSRARSTGMSAFVPRVLTLVQVQKSRMSQYDTSSLPLFDAMDDWLKGEEPVVHEEEWDMHMGVPASSHYAIIINALHPAQASTCSNCQCTFSDTLSEDLLPYGHMISPCSFSANGSTNPSNTHSRRSTGTFSNDLARSSASFTRIKKLWSSCKNKLRRLTSKQTIVSQSGTDAYAKCDTQQLVLLGSHLRALRAHGASSDKSWGNSSSTSHSGGAIVTDMTNSSVSTRRSSYSSSTESITSADCPKTMQQSVLGSSPGCLVLTPKALSDQVEHWQHAVKALGALSNWWKL